MYFFPGFQLIWTGTKSPSIFMPALFNEDFNLRLENCYGRNTEKGVNTLETYVNSWWNIIRAN